METTGVIMCNELTIEEEHEALVIAYVIADYDKNMSQEEVMKLAWRIVLACEEFGFSKADALQFCIKTGYGEHE